MLRGSPEGKDGSSFSAGFAVVSVCPSAESKSVLGKSESQYLQAYRAHFFLTFPPVLCNFFHWLLHNYASLSGVLVNLVF